MVSRAKLKRKVMRQKQKLRSAGTSLNKMTTYMVRQPKEIKVSNDEQKLGQSTKVKINDQQ